jgi:predicted dithiol-disulfide oxidoreductase (DUF899 family)
LRDELLEAEIALKDQRERVAALRRKLPLDMEIKDYQFHEGPIYRTPSRIIDLFQMTERRLNPVLTMKYRISRTPLKGSCP